MSNFRRRLMMSIKKKEKFDDFQELEYIESTGTQYIDTGIIATENHKIECTALFLSEGFSNYGAFDGKNRRHFGFYSGRNVLYMSNDNDPSISIPYVEDFLTYCYAPDVCYISKDGAILSSKLSASYNLYPNKNFYIFRRNSDGYSVGNGKSRCKTFRMVDIKAGRIVLDLIPCLDNNGTPCMYDKVNKKFYFNQGTGEFLYG